MYDPQTVAHEIKYPWRKYSRSKADKTGIGEWASKYRESFITIWHVDPEKPGTGNRRDDSCGWFDRTPGAYTDAVAYVLKDKAFVHEIKLTLKRKAMTEAVFYEGISEEQLSWPRLSPADSLALSLMVANELEMRRWWNGQNGKAGAHGSFWARLLDKRRSVADVATGLALNPIDNLSSVESPESMVHLVAAALNRHFRPWYKHPKWHFWHWKFQIHPLQKLRRVLFERCAHCKKGFKWGYCPTSHGGDDLYHSECSSIVWERGRKHPQPQDAHADAACSIH